MIFRLLEPYATTRAKGTGLGLAIVRKIMEEHSGRVELADGSEGGALVRLAFPIRTAA
jgi:nitrogen fixation/metabolism regulation signal transduction histidine kinase